MGVVLSTLYWGDNAKKYYVARSSKTWQWCETGGKYHLVELSIFPSYCCAAHLSVKSNNRKRGNNGNDQKGIENIFPSGLGYET